MSKRLDVVRAVLALVKAALPGAEVKGLDQDAAMPQRIPPNGLVIVRQGDPGEPEIDLCPPRYHYQHPIPIQIGGYETTGATAAETADTMLGAIGAAVAADRTLGGLCDWLEATAPGFDDITPDGARPALSADALIVAHYSTADPLGD